MNRKGSVPISDFRSDTVTRPCAAMRQAIAEAEVGDDVLRDDPTVERLEARVARLFEQDAALFVPTGTMGNQIAVKALTQPGDEVVCEASSHVFINEAGALGLISGVQVFPIPGAQGRLDLDQIRSAIRSVDIHHPRTRLVVLENTHNYAGGRVLPIEYLRSVRTLTRERGIHVHLDGARLFNAAVASGTPVAAYAREVDLLTFCLSKGLCCPVGSLLVGERTLIERCRGLRKALGGGLRQAGILAAAGLFALDHLVDRLKDDHRRARTLGEGLARLPRCRVDPVVVETNIVIVGRPDGDAARIENSLHQRGVWTFAIDAHRLRLVTHRDVGDADVERALHAFRELAAG